MRRDQAIVASRLLEVAGGDNQAHEVVLHRGEKVAPGKMDLGSNPETVGGDLGHVKQCRKELVGAQVAGVLRVHRQVRLKLKL